VELRNNLVSHNLRDRGGTAVLGNNLQNAPLSLFVNGADGDLHLLNTASSVIDQATTLLEVVDDVDGNSRPYGSAPDIGADELAAPPFVPTDWVYLPIVTNQP